MHRAARLAGGLVTMFCFAALAQAGTFSFFGSFAHDDQTVLFRFNVASTSNVTIQTFGYAGGPDLNGHAVPAGGFDPFLSLFDSNLFLIDEADDGPPATTRIDPVTGGQFDSELDEINLAPGVYYVALSESDNFALGPTLAAGFFRTGQGDFTAEFGCSNQRFCDQSGAANSNRTGAWDVSISGAGVTAAVLPEPATLTLFGLGLVAYRATRRRKSRSASHRVL